MSVDEREIEPDDVAELTPLARNLPPDFPIMTLLRFLPDIRLKQRVVQYTTEANAVDLSATDGPQLAEAALLKLREAMAAVTACFKEPTDLAHQLHKRLTSLRADFLQQGEVTAADLGRKIYAEQKRRIDAAEADRRRRQLEADAEQRRIAEQERKRAEAQSAPKELIEALKVEEATGAAPPVAAAPVAPLARSAPVAKWKARLKGDPEPDSSEASDAMRAFFRAVADALLPLVCAEINWAEMNRRANSERRSFSVPGLEAYDDGSTRSKGRR